MTQQEDEEEDEEEKVIFVHYEQKKVMVSQLHPIEDQNHDNRTQPPSELRQVGQHKSTLLCGTFTVCGTLKICLWNSLTETRPNVHKPTNRRRKSPK